MKPDVSRKYRSETHVRMVRETVEVVAETLLRIDYPKVATAGRGGSYEPDEAVAKGGSFEPPFACFCCGIRCSTPHQSETQKREGLPLYEVLQAPSHCCNSDLPELQTWMVRSSWHVLSLFAVNPTFCNITVERKAPRDIPIS